MGLIIVNVLCCTQYAYSWHGAMGVVRPGYIVFAAGLASHVGKCHRDVFQFPWRPSPPPRVHYANRTAVTGRDHSESEKSITPTQLKSPFFSVLSFYVAWTVPPPPRAFLCWFDQFEETCSSLRQTKRTTTVLFYVYLGLFVPRGRGYCLASVTDVGGGLCLTLQIWT